MEENKIYQIDKKEFEETFKNEIFNSNYRLDKIQQDWKIKEAYEKGYQVALYDFERKITELIKEEN